MGQEKTKPCTEGAVEPSNLTSLPQGDLGRCAAQIPLLHWPPELNTYRVSGTCVRREADSDE